tara:strand:- start:4137 stop:4583 length:447 start_codon:yes stop_codon:yes gene_type:complete
MAIRKNISAIAEEIKGARKVFEDDNDTWWNQLSEEEREGAFYAVCKRIHEADIERSLSYRSALYYVFEFYPGMYGEGMSCGYMEIHNSILDGQEYQKMASVNRIKVIDHDREGRSVEISLDKDEKLKYNLENGNKTLEVFINKKKIYE